MKSMRSMLYFDRQLLLQAEGGWLKAARIIGQVMLKHEGDPFAKDGILIRRLKFLVASRKLERKGNLSYIRFSEVRLPQKKRTGDPRSQ